MKKIGFDNEKYLRIQSERIRQRIAQFGDKLYLEFGGKLFDDNHASRVLPGFEPDSKLNMLMQLRDSLEIIIIISASDIEKNKVRNDLGITYDEDVLRLRDEFTSRGFLVSSVVVTHFNGQESAVAYCQKLERLGIRTYRHYLIEGYPNNIALIASEEGFGKNDFVETTKPLVVVTAPGPGSGKMASCLSQIYHHNRRGEKAGYAKFETFPIWNLPLKHPINIAYEAATADLDDINMIDPFHLEAYGKAAVNYNRDIEIFPVLNTLFDAIYGKSIYKSPTDMGVNMIGYCISDEEACCTAAREEVIRRYYDALCKFAEGNSDGSEVNKIDLLMKQARISIDDRRCAVAAKERRDASGTFSAAMELNDGTIITAEQSSLLGPSAALLINATKHLAGIDHSVKLIPARLIPPIQDMKVTCLHGHNPRLHTDEVLVALAVLSEYDENCRKAISTLPEMDGAQVHTTVMLSEVDRKVFKRLGIDLTCEPLKKRTKYYKS